MQSLNSSTSISNMNASNTPRATAMGLEYKPKNRRYYDSLRNYIMAYLPREHEMTILKFVDSAIMEAYKNGQIGAYPSLKNLWDLSITKWEY